jgi:hypothetical protein
VLADGAAWQREQLLEGGELLVLTAAPPFAQVMEDRRQRVVATARLVVARLVELDLATVVLAAKCVSAAARSAGGGDLAHANLTAVLKRALRCIG